MNPRTKILFIGAVFFWAVVSLPLSAYAANFYVRPDGITYGSGNGTDWNNAYSGFSGIAWASVAPGDTIWVAGGTYTQHLWTGKSGTSGSRIAIRRARSDASECTEAAGWSAGFDATITQVSKTLVFDSFDYITVSGATTASGGTHGWHVTFVGATEGSGIYWGNGSTGSHITVEWIDIEGPGPVTYTSDGRGIDDTPFTAATDHVFSHLKIHGWESAAYAVGMSNPTFEYIDVYDILAANWPSFHPNGIYTSAAPGGIVRNSRFHRGPGGNGVGEGIFFEQLGGSTGWQIYGNVFYDLNQTGQKAIEISSNVGNIKIFNNTFDDLIVPAVFLNTGGACGSGAEVRNNLGYQASFSSGTEGGCGTMSNNLVVSSTSVWVNRAARDYHIVTAIGAGFPRNAGVSLASFFTTDKDGVTFGGDGTWDIGAYEFIASAPPPSNTFYIRQGATGNGSGSDWTNAYTTLPATLQRGATYYIADGTYSGYTFDDPVSGTQLITIKKATVADHGTSTGWDNTYGDGTAAWSPVAFLTSYWIFDGSTGGGPGSWTSGFGFTFTSTAGTNINYVSMSDGVSNITVRHCSFTQTGNTEIYTVGGHGFNATPGAWNTTISRI